MAWLRTVIHAKIDGMDSLRLRVNSFVARHPMAGKVLRWMNVYNPGTSINP